MALFPSDPAPPEVIHGKAGVKGSSPFVGFGFWLCRAKFCGPASRRLQTIWRLTWRGGLRKGSQATGAFADDAEQTGATSATLRCLREHLRKREVPGRSRSYQRSSPLRRDQRLPGELPHLLRAAPQAPRGRDP